jgi:CheY-like chemotaxis protein
MPSRVLVVDDEASLLALIERILRQDGYEVTSVISGVLALEAIRKQLPDLIILDLNLPDMNGQDICEEVRKNPATQNIPIIILTGRNVPGLSTKTLL